MLAFQASLVLFLWLKHNTLHTEHCDYTQKTVVRQEIGIQSHICSPDKFVCQLYTVSSLDH